MAQAILASLLACLPHLCRAVQESSLIWNRLREHWGTFRHVARGELDQSSLPTWEKRKAINDEIPF
jgi:hypothetical protein